MSKIAFWQLLSQIREKMTFRQLLTDVTKILKITFL